MLIPKPLRPGSNLRIIAPSGPFDRALVLRAMGWLGSRYHISFEPALFEREGFLAGSDERRQSELVKALRDPNVDAVLAARGGHGLLRIVHSIPWGLLREQPRWLIGFSDPTVLHAEAWKLGVASVHAANLAGLGRGDAAARELWISVLESPAIRRVLRGRPGVPGRVTGPLAGGNLTVLTMLAAAGRLCLPEGCILAIEDVTETSYRVDRMLTVLHAGGHLDRVAGFALGQFTDCGSGASGVTTSDVLAERLCRRRPLVHDLPFGHGRDNHPLVFGPPASIDGLTGELTFGGTHDGTHDGTR